VIVDASVWVARFLLGDKHHAAASACITRLLHSGQRLTVPVLAWAEVAGAIARRSGSDETALQALVLLQQRRWIDAIAIDRTLGEQAAQMAAQYKLRGADAVYLALAAARSLPLITLDQEMLQRGPASVPRLTPSDWLQGQAT
jgi:predicted nucleic acid-binding protein